MSQSPNMTIRLAIVAAGGVKRVSEHFGTSQGAISAWHLRGIVPTEHILDLCRLGGGRFTPEQIIEEVAEVKRAKTRARMLADLEKQERERKACGAGVQ